MTQRIPIVVLAASALLVAGCTNGGSGQLTGKSQATGGIELASATVTDGILRSIEVHAKPAAAVPASDPALVLHGTTGGQRSYYNATVHVPALAANATENVTVDQGTQPDWQDGTDLTIELISRDGTNATLTITTV